MKKGLSAEDVAASMLENLGYSILERRKPVVVGGVKIAEIDIVAKDPDGNVFVVEVKSGKASVTDVRQVYSNSKLLEAKPLLVCKGFSDSSAISLASELDVKYLLMPEYYLFTLEDFKEVAKEIIYDLLILYFSLDAENLSEEDIKLIETISSSNSFSEAAVKLNLSDEELGRKISTLGFFKLGEKHTFNHLKLQALVIENKLNKKKHFENIERKIDELRTR